MLKITVFTEAGGGYGYGHLSRCNAVVDAFAAFGFAAELVARGEGRADWESDKAAFEGCDIVVVDSYTAAVDAYITASQKAKVCVWLDDFGRLSYPKGIIHDCSEKPLLRKEFWSAAKKDISQSVQTVFINLGSAPLEFDFKRAAREAFGERIEIVELKNADAKGVREAMMRADVAISAAGQTLLELACMGVPSVAVITAQNQLPNATKLQNIGFCKVMTADTLEATKECLRSFVGKAERAVSSVAGQKYIDKIAALELAANALCELGLKAPQKIASIDADIVVNGLTLKPFWSLGAEDLTKLLEWRNHERVREWMFCKEPIAWSEHVSFAENLRTVKTKAYWMAEDVGAVSLTGIDYEAAKADIGIYKAPSAPKGSGAKLLEALIKVAFLDIGLAQLCAEVFADNEAAIALYKRFGFCFDKEYEKDGKKVSVYELKREVSIA